MKNILTWFIVILQANTEVIIQGELVTPQHLRPGEAIFDHEAFTGPFHCMAQGPTGPNRSVQTDRGE